MTYSSFLISKMGMMTSAFVGLWGNWCDAHQASASEATYFSYTVEHTCQTVATKA